MKMSFANQFLLILALLLSPLIIGAQSALQIALRQVEQNHKIWNLSDEDVTDLIVSDQYLSQNNGVTHLYLQQRFQGIEVFNALLNFNITKDGEVLYVGKRFIPQLSEKINASVPELSPYQAIEVATQHLGIALEEPLRQISQIDEHEFVFEKGTISNNDIPVKLCFQPMKDGSLRLAWNLSIDEVGNADYWSLRIDALTGELLSKNNWTRYCSFGEKSREVGAENCFDDIEKTEIFEQNRKVLAPEDLPVQNASYEVFPTPIESPIHGNRELVVNPSDAQASPFGWHDTNGQEGPEFTITRGNNVHAYLDTDGDDIPDGGEPNGGSNLVFDFLFDVSLEPDTLQAAATTQLFYMNNIMHDLAYSYGFDEVAGNFQQNNYGHGGSGGDYVRAESQDGAGVNNANFSTPTDGFNGTMQMFLWNSSSGDNALRVNAPSQIEGLYEARPGLFGGAITTTPLTGEVAIVNDGTPQFTLGCNELVNGDEISGKIALIDRGSCQFGTKALNAQNAGAIAVLVCNFEDALVTMAGGDDGGQVTIPAVFMKKSTCDLIRPFAGQGLVVSLQTPDNTGPTQIDGDFDNGIIAHEYAHGISTRLTGGPSQANCLFNDEQMGEGWSDFFTLITTAKTGDTGDMPHGIGTYVFSQQTNGGGIRRFPYSTDFSVNSQTYDDIIGTGPPHPLGEVWTDVLWDMYWKFVEVYGWDPDLYHGSGGNNMAIQLVFDGMKIQACSPGFLDGRDAILAADEADFGGDNQCLIWEIFARRGLGWSADQGSANDRNDNTPGFDVKPQCIKELKVQKSVTDLILAGDDIAVTLTVSNDKEVVATNVILTDEIPQGASFVGGSSTIPAQLNANLLTFELGNMDTNSQIEVSYKLSTDPANFSVQKFFDGMENGDDNWQFDAFEGNTIWEITDLIPFDGDFHWFIPDDSTNSDQVIWLDQALQVSGDKPVFRFYHKYDTEFGFDGGFLEISVDGGAWEILDGSKIFRNSYRGKIAFTTFAIPFLNAFWGDSGGYIASYIDLSDYIGQDVNIRFRFGADGANPEGFNGLGWFIDDVEFMDMFNYNSEACVTSEEGDFACAAAPAKGTIVESQVLTATNERQREFEVAVYPNPAQDVVNIAISTDKVKEIQLSLMTVDGKTVMARHISAFGQQTISLNVASLPGGFYLLKMSTKEDVLVKKIVVQ